MGEKAEIGGKGVNFSGMGWIGYPQYLTGTTWGAASVTGEEDIVVPAGVA